MSIKDLKTVNSLPKDIQLQIETVLNTRTHTTNMPLLKGYEYVWALWDAENRDFTTWCAKLLASSFFLAYLKNIQSYLEKKYTGKINLKDIFKEDISLEKNVGEVKKLVEGKIAVEDLNWLNQEILPSIARVITCITSENITTEDDLVSMANIGNKQLDLMENYAEEGEEREYQLREIFLTYIDNLIKGKFIDKLQYDIRDKMDYVKDFRFFAFNKEEKYVALGSIYQNKEEGSKMEIENQKKFPEVTGKLE